jgi:hypothetical protein
VFVIVKFFPDKPNIKSLPEWNIFYCLNEVVRIKPSPQIFDLSEQNLKWRNDVAYFSAELINKNKSLIILTPGAANC